MLDLLVVAAHPPDLRGVRDVLGDTLDGSLNGLRIGAKTVGLGSAAAAASTAKRIVQLEPRGVVHIGTCGVYPERPGYQPYDVVVPNQVWVLSLGVDHEWSAFPDPMTTRREADPAMTAGLAVSGARVHAAPVGSPNAETRSDQAAAHIAQHQDLHAENLEAFGIAQACHLLKIPYAACLGVTHIVGALGMQDWRQFHRRATVSAAEVLFQWLRSGAQGLPHRAR